MNRRSITISISGIITLLTTIIIGLLCMDDWPGLTGWAFCAILWSEFVFFSGLVFTEWAAAKTEQIITRSALYVLLSGYAILNILVSILFIAFFQEAASAFAGIEVVLFALSAIAIVISLTASKSIRQSNELTLHNVLNIDSMIERLNKLAVTPKCEAYSPSLRKAGEKLRFADHSVQVPEDAEINNTISSIEIDVANDSGNMDDKIKANLIQLNTLIAKRKISAKRTV